MRLTAALAAAGLMAVAYADCVSFGGRRVDPVAAQRQGGSRSDAGSRGRSSAGKLQPR